MTTRLFLLTLLLALLLSACAAPGGAGAKVIKSGTIGGLTVELANDDGVLRHGDEEFTVTFKDAAGKPVDVGAASLNFFMPAMGTMPVMNNPVTFTTTGTPGVYQGKAKIEMAGEWQAQIAYDGPAGKGQGSFPVIAQ